MNLTAGIVIASIILFAFSQNLNEVFAQESEPSERDQKLLEYITTIEELLTRADEEYAAGNKDEALRLATLAYIDNYEYVEEELGSVDEELIEDVEWKMREELLGLIRNDAPVDQVQGKIDEILVRMDDIVAIIPEFGILASLTLSIGIIMSIVLLSKRPTFLRL